MGSEAEGRRIKYGKGRRVGQGEMQVMMLTESVLTMLFYYVANFKYFVQFET